MSNDNEGQGYSLENQISIEENRKRKTLPKKELDRLYKKHKCKQLTQKEIEAIYGK